MHAIELPISISAYFEAKNRHDVDGMVRVFADDASVRDEGHEYRGRAAIRAWLEDVTSRYAVSAEPQTATADGAVIVVSTQIAGNFPGSPVVLDFRFTPAGAQIARLEID